MRLFLLRLFLGLGREAALVDSDAAIAGGRQVVPLVKTNFLLGSNKAIQADGRFAARQEEPVIVRRELNCLHWALFPGAVLTAKINGLAACPLQPPQLRFQETLLPVVFAASLFPAFFGIQGFVN